MSNSSIYIAAPFFNAEQLASVQFVEDCLRYAKVPYHSPRKDGVLLNMTPEERAKNSKRIFDANIKGMVDSCGMIALVDDKDTGTSFEIGYAYGSWSSIVTFSRKSSEANLMLAHATVGHLRGDGEMLEFAKAMHAAKKTELWFVGFCEEYPFSKLVAST